MLHVLFGVARGLDREEVVDRRVRYEARGAATAGRHVRHFLAGRDRGLVGDGRHGDDRGRPAAEIRLRGCAHIFELGDPQFGGQAVLATLRPVLQQWSAVHADRGGEREVAEKRAVADELDISAGIAEAARVAKRFEVERARVARCHRLVQAEDAVAVLLVFADEPAAGERQPDQFGFHVGVANVDVADGRRRQVT